MMSEQRSRLVFLRLALGLEMILSSIMVSFSSNWNHVFANQAHLLIWSVILAFGGMWLMTSSLVGIHTSGWFGTERRKNKGVSAFFNRQAMAEFFYCGAVWGGIWWESLANPQHHFLDVLAPLNIAFLLFLACRDSAAKRKKATYHEHSAREGATVIPINGMADPVRLRAERLRR